MAADLTREERLQIMLSPEELTALDDWRFAKRMPSRAAAVRELLKRGLSAEGWSVAQSGMKSGAFGVTQEQKPPADGYAAPPQRTVDGKDG